MYRKWGTLVLFLLAVPLAAAAQNTGKLSGVITDRATGEPLPGATVVIEGTQLGTASDVNGNYFILGVPVGTYDIRASFVGYESVLVQNVEVNAGYTRELNFELSSGVALDEVVVEYERPLIQRDALGTPRVVTGEELANMPVRGVANIAALQSGVVANEGSTTLNVRGGRGEEVTYYVDGVKVVGNLAVAQSAIAEQEMLIGGLPAKYGDAMSGVISVTTKAGAPNFFGNFEAITSEVLDSYGYNLFSGALGGPIVRNRASFFFAGEFEANGDQRPTAIGLPQLSGERLDQILAAPQVVEVTDAGGVKHYLPVPDGVQTPADLRNAFAAQGVVTNLNPQSAVLFLDEEDFSTTSAKPFNESQALRLNGNLTFNPVRSVRLRAGGGFQRSLFDSFSYVRSFFNSEQNTYNDQNTWRAFGSWTHYLSGATFYQVQADVSDFHYWSYDRDFSKNVEDVLFYGDIDHAANAVAARYRQLQVSGGDSTYVRQFSDSILPSTSGIASQLSLPGAQSGGYTKGRSQQFRLSANAQTQLGINLIEFGGEFEQRTQRAFFFDNAGDANSLARFYKDGTVEAGESQGVDSYVQLPRNILDSRVTYYGYNYLGTEEVDSDNVNSFANTEATDPAAYNVAPYKPIYYAGYIQDKIEYRDLVVQLGVRVDVFDNNTRVLRDPYALFPIVRAGDVGNQPTNIGSDYAVYFQGNQVVGFRDLEGQFYNENGQAVDPTVVTTRGEVRLPDGVQRRLSEDVFTDYKPQVTVQPRIGVTFPVTDQALFFAHYDVLAQRPTERARESIQLYQVITEGSGTIGNPNLRPQTTIEYELGFRQRVGTNAALQISGFYKQIKNLIQERQVKNAFPSNYLTFQNVDFGTVKGVEFEFDLRRTRNVSLNANYTLSYANGTGSDAGTTGNIFWLREANAVVPTFISPLDFDRRHTLNLTLDYRLGDNEGPELFGARPLENFGFNVVASYKSGQPYSALQDPYPINAAVKLTSLRGGINAQNMPASSLVNLRVDREFPLSRGTSLTAFLWVENLLDTDNVVNVYRASGLADNDAFLDTDLGRTDYPIGSAERMYYDYRIRNPYNFGIPRQTRLGLRFNF